MFNIIKLAAISAALAVATSSRVAPKSYSCIDGICELQSALIADTTNNGKMSQSTCLMMCGNGSIWPYPNGKVAINEKFAVINKFSDNFVLNINSPVLNSAVDSFYSSVRSTKQSVSRFNSNNNQATNEKGQGFSVNVIVKDASIVVASMEVDESYSLTTSVGDNKIVVTISANTVFGARHGIETLSQLVAWDYFANAYVVASSVEILNDNPTYRYRGVMLDLSRHFQPIDNIKRTVRAMSYNKMNVLHLHLADSSSFPIILQKQSNITYHGAYSEVDSYTLDELRDLAEYSNNHGVIIVPELDGPSHVAMGYQWGPDAGLGDLVICTDPQGVEQTQWTHSGYEPATGQLNLANENIYPILADVHAEIINVLSYSSVFHVGGDEIMVGTDLTGISCYNSTTKAVDIMKLLEEKGMDRSDPQSFFTLWADYIKKIEGVVDNAFDSKTDSNNVKLQKLHIWGGGGQDASGVVYNIVDQPNVNTVLPQDKYTIQVWDESSGSITPNLIKQGYDVVLSNTDYVYMDCGTFGWTEPGGYWCQPYHEWQHLYNYISDVKQAWEVSADDAKWNAHALGSETLAWGETIGPSNLDAKLWPRTAGLAEALWGRTAQTAHKAGSWYDADPRMQRWSVLMRARGIQAEPLQAQWCDERGAYACSVNRGSPQ